MEHSEFPLVRITLANGSIMTGRFNDIEIARFKRDARGHGVPVISVEEATGYLDTM
jgi:hypothetical protein